MFLRGGQDPDTHRDGPVRTQGGDSRPHAQDRGLGRDLPCPLLGLSLQDQEKIMAPTEATPSGVLGCGGSQEKPCRTTQLWILGVRLAVRTPIIFCLDLRLLPWRGSHCPLCECLCSQASESSEAFLGQGRKRRHFYEAGLIKCSSL